MRNCSSCRWWSVVGSCRQPTRIGGSGRPSKTPARHLCDAWEELSAAAGLVRSVGSASLRGAKTVSSFVLTHIPPGVVAVSHRLGVMSGLAARRVRSRARSAQEAAGSASDLAARMGNAILGTEYALAMDRWMRATFADGKATLYDRAMDANYAKTHVGGADHRLFDGGHDLLGAWKAAGEAAAARGDDLAQQVAGYATALWKDVVTPKGLPVVTFDKATFDAIAGHLSADYGIPVAWLKDMATFTATEVVGAAIAAIAVALNWSRADIERVTGLASSLAISTIAAASPFLAIVAVACLARAYQQASQPGADLKAAAFGLAQGSAGSMTLLGVSALVGGPAWVGLVAGLGAGVAVHRGMAWFRNAPSEGDLREVADFMAEYTRRLTITSLPAPDRSISS